MTDINQEELDVAEIDRRNREISEARMAIMAEGFDNLTPEEQESLAKQAVEEHKTKVMEAVRNSIQQLTLDMSDTDLTREEISAQCNKYLEAEVATKSITDYYTYTPSEQPDPSQITLVPFIKRKGQWYYWRGDGTSHRFQYDPKELTEEQLIGALNDSVCEE